MGGDGAFADDDKASANVGRVLTAADDEFASEDVSSAITDGLFVGENEAP